MASDEQKNDVQFSIDHVNITQLFSFASHVADGV